MTETLVHVDELEPQEPLEESAAGEAFGAAAPDAQPVAGPDLSAANAAVIRQMVLAAKDAGMDLTGPGGLLKQLTKMVIETALDEEMNRHGFDAASFLVQEGWVSCPRSTALMSGLVRSGWCVSRLVSSVRSRRHVRPSVAG